MVGHTSLLAIQDQILRKIGYDIKNKLLKQLLLLLLLLVVVVVVVVLVVLVVVVVNRGMQKITQ